MKVLNEELVCIIGTGTMGSSIALDFAWKGWEVYFCANSAKGLERGRSLLESFLQVLEGNNLVEPGEMTDILSRVHGTGELGTVPQDVPLVVECAPEDLGIKQEVFRRLEEHFSRKTVFATNTSGLMPTKIAETLAKKDRFLAAHFWNPAHLLPLVEIMPGEGTSQETVAFAMGVMEKIGKEPVLLFRETPGYIGNRLQYAMLREALYLVDAGIASMEDVDRAVKYGIGRRLGATGPLETADLGGTHVFAAISETLLGELTNTTEVSPTLKGAVARGDLGYSTGRGLYEWPAAKLEKVQKERQQALMGWLRKDRERRQRGQ